MKRCPKCKNNKVIIFDSNNEWCPKCEEWCPKCEEWCPKCEEWFPAVANEEDKCEVSCQHFTGGEVKHNKDCYFYPESRTKMHDDLKAKSKKLEKALEDMHFAYINKDSENPHQFEEEAIKQYEALVREETSEIESPKTLEWYKAQAEELLDIRKAFHRLLGDTANGNDAYFPDLVERELRKLKDGN